MTGFPLAFIVPAPSSTTMRWPTLRVPNTHIAAVLVWYACQADGDYDLSQAWIPGEASCIKERVGDQIWKLQRFPFRRAIAKGVASDDCPVSPSTRTISPSNSRSSGCRTFASRLFEVTSNFPGSTVEPVSSFCLVQPKNWHYVKDCVRLRLRVANNEEWKVPLC